LTPSLPQFLCTHSLNSWYPEKYLTSIKGYLFQNATILIVDDIIRNRILLKKSLIKTKAIILEATNGQEGIYLAAQHIHNLILMDITLPVMDGYEALT